MEWKEITHCSELGCCTSVYPPAEVSRLRRASNTKVSSHCSEIIISKKKVTNCGLRIRAQENNKICGQTAGDITVSMLAT